METYFTTVNGVQLKKIHTRRLREIYRSAGWPCLDVIEIELLAAGLLERLTDSTGHERIRVTDLGIQHLAAAAQSNRKAMDVHDGLVERIVQTMLRDGRLVWTNLNLRAKVTVEGQEDGKWKYCKPDVFSIRNSSKQDYIEPVVHEIKVSRADLLGDLKRPEKRLAYLELGGQCWYVLGRDAKNRPIAEPDEVPKECGVMQVVNDGIEILRQAPQKQSNGLPFGIWMVLAKAVPIRSWDLEDEANANQKRLMPERDQSALDR
jgi:hypothetical protein